MVFKSVFTFYSEVEVTIGIYPFPDCSIVIETIKLPFQTDDNIHFKTITCETDEIEGGSIEDIYFKHFDKIEIFIGLVSNIGYCPAKLCSHVITSPKYCTYTIAFQVLSKDIFHTRIFKYGIEPSDFINITVDSEDTKYLKQAIIFINKSLSTESLEEKVILLYSALERIASHNASDYIEKTCSNCNFVQPTKLKDVKKYIKSILIEGGAPASEVDLFYILRNKIAHGSGSRNPKFYSEIRNVLISIQHIIIEFICKAGNINQVNSQTSILDLPMAVYTFVKFENNGFELADNQSAAIIATAGISQIKGMSEKALDNLEFRMGIYTDEKNIIFTHELRENYFPI